MQARERALEQADGLITMALVLLLIAGMMIVAMTVVLSSEDTPFSPEGAEVVPATLSSISSMPRPHVDANLALVSIT